MISLYTILQGKDGIYKLQMGIFLPKELIIQQCYMMDPYIYLADMMEKQGLAIYINAH